MTVEIQSQMDGIAEPRQWYYVDTLNQVQGPFTTGEVKELAKQSDFYVWREGMADWVQAYSLDELHPNVYQLKPFPYKWQAVDPAVFGTKLADRPTSIATQQSDFDGQPFNRAFNRTRNEAKTVNEFLGICKGILIDNDVSVEEAKYLRQWVDDHREFAGQWPISQAASRLNALFSDHAPTDEERQDLLGILQQITGVRPDAQLAATLATRLPLDIPAPQILFKGKMFCVTGKCVLGARKKVEEMISLKGASCLDHLTYAVDYLVIGTLASRDWIHASYGRKIEEAVGMKTSGHANAIIGEEHLQTFL